MQHIGNDMGERNKDTVEILISKNDETLSCADNITYQPYTRRYMVRKSVTSTNGGRSLSTSYLNHTQNYDIELEKLAIKWVRGIFYKAGKSRIHKPKRNKRHTGRARWGRTSELVTTQSPPQTTKDIRLIRYDEFGNLAGLLLNYETYYGTWKETKELQHVKRNKIPNVENTTRNTMGEIPPTELLATGLAGEKA